MGKEFFSAGKRLLSSNLIDEVNENRKCLIKPKLGNGNYKFYLTEKGKETYEKTILISHKKYLPNIKL